MFDELGSLSGILRSLRKILRIAPLPRFPFVGNSGLSRSSSGNGRSFFQPHVAGAQWRFGGVGNSHWSGVRLKDVLKEADVRRSATQLLLDGADAPFLKMPKFQRTLEVSKAMHPDSGADVHHRASEMDGSYGRKRRRWEGQID